MPGLGGLFGEGSTASQFLIWGVGYAIAERLLAPVLADIQQAVWEAHPDQVESPAELADHVVRTIMDRESAAAEAAKSGIGAERFGRMVKGAGEPPGLEFLLQAYRRGFIPFGPTAVGDPSVLEGVATGRIYNYWGPVIEKMLSVPLPPADAVNAALRGQVPYAEGEREAFASGIDPARFRVLFDSAGRPPSPSELIELYRRKLIPLQGTGPDTLSFQQGIYEGDTKDKWWHQFAALAEYRPPPRTITALAKAGAIDAQEEATLYQEAGLSPRLAAAYAKAATGEKMAGTRQLAQGVVLTLYEAQGITHDAALGYLGKLGYGPTESALVLELADAQRELRALNGAVSRIGTLYVGHKITRPGASSALAALKLDGPHIGHLLATWDQEMAANVRPLTEAQITGAVYYKVLSVAEGMAELQAIGMTPFDAWVAISVRLKGPQPNRPARGPGGPAVT